VDSAFSGWLDCDPIAYHARGRPDATAVIEVSTGERHSYAAMDERVAKTTGWLAARGVRCGDRIAYLGRSGAWQIAVLFAARRIGAIFAPINWRLSGPEVAVIAADAKPALFIADVEFAGAAMEALADLPGVSLFVLEPRAANLAAGAACAKPAPAVAADPAAPFILLYTSGTTGKPKGVIITRQGAFFAGFNFAAVGQVTPNSVMLCDAPLFHTVGLMAVCQTALQTGAAAALTDRFLPDVTLKAISDPSLAVTHYFAVPQIAQMLRDHPDYATSDLSRLTALFTGGAPMPPSLIEAFLDDGVTLANGYGMTETGTALCMPLDPALIRQRLTASGLPAPAIQLRIVTAEGLDAPIGQSGEIWMKGPGVTPGYWMRPDENAKAFVDGWLRTGDAGMVDAGGYYTLLDRWKDMYITGGENVYPAEVEAVFQRLPGVSEVAVIGVPDPRWGEAGLAFIVVESGSAPDPEDLIAACRTHLAGYKRPRAVRFIEALPRTASGKVKKDILRQLATTDA